MEDIRAKREDVKKRIIWLKFKIFLKKNKWYLISGITIAAVIIFPSATGTAIGNWITNFLGSIINNINI
jgi:hypothetical protein